jgi:hypothetical protein
MREIKLTKAQETSVRPLRARLKPLEQWICDACGEVIQRQEHGWLEWLRDRDDRFRASGFKIVHDSLHSPRGQFGCYHYTNHRGRSDAHLAEYVGSDATAWLLGLLARSGRRDSGVKDIWEFAELVRRLTIPYYEEARQYWNRAETDGVFDGANEVSPYTQRTLRHVIDTYGEGGPKAQE